MVGRATFTAVTKKEVTKAATEKINNITLLFAPVLISLPLFCPPWPEHADVLPSKNRYVHDIY